MARLADKMETKFLSRKFRKEDFVDIISSKDEYASKKAFKILFEYGIQCEKQMLNEHSNWTIVCDVEKIKESASFQEGMATLRQISFGLLDMAFHSNNPSAITDIKAFEKAAFEKTNLYPDVAENCMSVSFSHIFQGGYSSGYYSYKWAEVLDADAFAYFQEKGIFNSEVATKFKENILSKGGTEHPMILYKRFRGQEPKPEALLKRAGLI